MDILLCHISCVISYRSRSYPHRYRLHLSVGRFRLYLSVGRFRLYLSVGRFRLYLSVGRFRGLSLFSYASSLICGINLLARRCTFSMEFMYFFFHWHHTLWVYSNMGLTSDLKSRLKFSWSRQLNDRLIFAIILVAVFTFSCIWASKVRDSSMFIPKSFSVCTRPSVCLVLIWFYWMFYDHFSARSLLAKLGRWGWWWGWGWLERKARRHQIHHPNVLPSLGLQTRTRAGASSLRVPTGGEMS